MQVSVCLGAILIPEYLDFHSGYSAPPEYIPEYILIPEYIPNERALRLPPLVFTVNQFKMSLLVARVDFESRVTFEPRARFKSGSKFFFSRLH